MEDVWVAALGVPFFERVDEKNTPAFLLCDGMYFDGQDDIDPFAVDDLCVS